MLIVLVVMVPIALLSANPSRSWLARATRRISFGYGLLAGALPDFWLGLVLIFVFSACWGGRLVRRAGLAILDLPPARVTGFYVVDTLLAGISTL